MASLRNITVFFLGVYLSALLSRSNLCTAQTVVITDIVTEIITTTAPARLRTTPEMDATSQNAGTNSSATSPGDPYTRTPPAASETPGPGASPGASETPDPSAPTTASETSDPSASTAALESPGPSAPTTAPETADPSASTAAPGTPDPSASTTVLVTLDPSAPTTTLDSTGRGETTSGSMTTPEREEMTTEGEVPATTPPEEPLSAGAIAGIVIGSVAGAALIAGGVGFAVFHFKNATKVAPVSNDIEIANISTDNVVEVDDKTNLTPPDNDQPQA